MSETAAHARDVSFNPANAWAERTRTGARTRRFLPWDYDPKPHTSLRHGQIPENCTSQDGASPYEEPESVLDHSASIRRRRQGGQSQRRDPARRQPVRRPALARVSEPAGPDDVRGQVVREGRRVARLQAACESHGGDDAGLHEPLQAHARPVRARRLLQQPWLCQRRKSQPVDHRHSRPAQARTSSCDRSPTSSR